MLKPPSLFAVFAVLVLCWKTLHDLLEELYRSEISSDWNNYTLEVGAAMIHNETDNKRSFDDIAETLCALRGHIMGLKEVDGGVEDDYSTCTEDEDHGRGGDISHTGGHDVDTNDAGSDKSSSDSDSAFKPAASKKKKKSSKPTTDTKRKRSVQAKKETSQTTKSTSKKRKSAKHSAGSDQEASATESETTSKKRKTNPNGARVSKQLEDYRRYQKRGRLKDLRWRRRDLDQFQRGMRKEC